MDEQSTITLSPEEIFKRDHPDIFALSEQLKKEKLEREVRKQNNGGKWKSGGTYYKEHFAEEIRFVLDAMISDNKDRIYSYSKFHKYSKSSLNMKLRQSWHYLMDKMDVTGKYRALWNRTKIGEDENRNGVRIEFLRTITEADIILPDILDDKTKSFEWRHELDEWLVTGASGTMFKKEYLNLSDEDVENLVANIELLTNVECKITKNKILIIKTE